MVARRANCSYKPPISGKLLAVDTETTGVDIHHGGRPFLYVVCNDKGDAVPIYDDRSPDPATGMFCPQDDRIQGPNRRLLAAWMADPTITKVFHNAQYDIKMMRAFGIEVRGQIHDTMIMAHSLNAHGEAGAEHDDVRTLEKLSLDTLATKYLHKAKNDEPIQWLRSSRAAFRRQHNRAPNYSDMPRDLMSRYAVKDVALTLELFFLMEPHLDRLRLRETYEREMQLMPVVIEMEERGVRLDVPFMKRRIVELRDLEKQSLCRLRSMSPVVRTVKVKTRRRSGQPAKVQQLVATRPDEINFGSDLQIAKVFDVLGIKVDQATPTGRPKLDERTLSRIEHPFCKELVRYRRYQKIRGTYFEGYLARAVDETLHTQYLQIGTHTGRFSSRNPNLQNLPMEKVVRERAGADVVYKGVKRAFVPREGFANYHADYSQVELRLAAHFADDRRLTEVINSGRDVHGEVCKALFGEITEDKRALAKIVTFGYLYGMGLRTFQWKLKVDSEAKTREILDLYFDVFPGMRAFQERMIRQVREQGHIRNLLGRRYLVNPNFAYKAVNYCVQGSAADVLKRAMIRVHDFFRRESPRSALLLTIHDEIVFEVPLEHEFWVPKRVIEIMQSNPECRLPLKVSLERENGSWESLEKVTT